MPASTTLRRGSELKLPFDLILVRTPRRKSMSIVVRHGEVSVRAAIGVAETTLLAFVRQKQQWISEKLLEQQHRQQQVPVRIYQTGEKIPFLGLELTLAISQGLRAAISLDAAQTLQVTTSSRSVIAQETQVKTLLQQWLKAQALSILTAKTQQLAATAGLKVNAVSVKATKSRWGQCTSRGDIQYNWLILMAPMPIVDYLVAHEVAHLRHPNHSPQFWAQVEQFCPDWSIRRRWLREHGSQLVL